MNIKYRHYITHLGIETEVFPLSFRDSCTLDWEDDDKEIFKRKVLKGKLKFSNIKSITDYTYFKSINDDPLQRCDELSYRLDRSCDNGASYITFWNGYFVTTDGEFDIDRCVFTVEPLPDDIYRCILEHSEDEFTLNVRNRVYVSAYLLPNYEYYVCRNTSGVCDASRPLPNASTTWLVLHTEQIDGVYTTIYYREIARVACEASTPVAPNGSGWALKSDTCSIDGLATYVRAPATIYTPNNPSPYVQAGNCISGASYPPPHRKRLTVTKQNTTPTPIIRGKSAIALLGGPVIYSCDTETYFIDDNPGSTYVWSISGSGNTIDSGQGTYKVNVTLHSAGTISVIETTACGASSSASQAITLTGGGSGTSTYNSNVEMIGREEVCAGSTGEYYLNASIGSYLDISGGTSAGSTIDSGTTTNGITKYLITFGTTGTVGLLWNGGASCDSSTAPTIGTLTVKSQPKTPGIKGETTVCKSQQSKYLVPINDSISAYNWVVSGGTITAGQGTNEITVTWDGSAGTGYVYCYETIAGDCGCEWIKIVDSAGSAECTSETEPTFYFCPPDSKVIYDRPRLVYDLLDYVKTDICPEITQIVSDFFEWNPIGDAPGYSPGINYITGSANAISLLALIGKNDILGLHEDQYDSKLSWKKLTAILREAFQVYWHIDALGNARFEHINFYQRAVKFDLTSPAYSLKAFYRNIYSYNKDGRPKYERFKWSEAVNTDFVGAEIRYNSLCINKDPKQNISQNGLSFVTTDISYINTSPTRISKDGFALVVLEISGLLYTVASEAGLITGLIQPNAHLSWANLHYNYFRHYRVLFEGYMNLIPESFLSVKRTKSQKDVKLNYCCGDDLDGQTDLITTEIGDGSISATSLDLKSDILKTDLLFESDE